MAVDPCQDAERVAVDFGDRVAGDGGSGLAAEHTVGDQRGEHA
jgi:hypothetical protein